MRHHSLSLSIPAVVAVFSLLSCGTTKTFPVRTYNMGDPVTLGRLTYTVYETRWLSRLGEDPAPRIPQHRFFLIRASIGNGASTDVMAPNLTVEDSKGTVYQEISNGEGVPQWIGYLRHIKPADAVQGYLLFDVPPGAYNLRVWDENSERAALVAIPLSFNSETPEPSPLPPVLPKE